MKTSNVLIGTALTAAVGYAIADGLARACSYAEEVENDEFCSPSSTAAPAVALPGVSGPGRGLLQTGPVAP